MKTFKVEVYREDKWWMVVVPELDGLTQARRFGEAARMAREFIAVHEDLKLDDVAVELTLTGLPGVAAADVAALVEDAARVAAEEAEVSGRRRAIARALVAAKVPLRDVGELLGVSYQRAHQLVAEEGK